MDENKYEEAVEEMVEEMTIEEKFEAAKKIECEILDAKIILCSRIDTYIDIRNIYKDYFGETPTFDTVMHYVELCKFICMKMREICGNFEFKDFVDADMEDPYLDLTRTVEECEDDRDCFEAMIRFNFVRPFGERALKLNRLVIEDIDAMEAAHPEDE